MRSISVTRAPRAALSSTTAIGSVLTIVSFSSSVRRRCAEPETDGLRHQQAAFLGPFARFPLTIGAAARARHFADSPGEILRISPLYSPKKLH
jgi:hypothetical protein